MNGVDTSKDKSVLIIDPIITYCTCISADLPFNVSTPFNSYQQAFIAAKPVPFDRVIQCWILSLTIK